MLVIVAATGAVATAAPKDGGQRWWGWVLVGSGAVLIGGALWVATLGRRRGPPLQPAGGTTLPITPALAHARETVVLKTIPLHPAGRTTLAITPVPAHARETVRQLPPPGLAAWLVVYRDGIPCETLVLQSIGVTTIGRASSSSIRFEDVSVGQRHATITAAGGRFVLEDATDPKPQHPTKVDDDIVDGPIELRDNMRLQIGSTRVRFKCTA